MENKLLWEISVLGNLCLGVLRERVGGGVGVKGKKH